MAVINRRLHKHDESKDVLEKVTLIKDIRAANPHRARTEISFDLSIGQQARGHGLIAPSPTSPLHAKLPGVIMENRLCE